MFAILLIPIIVIALVGLLAVTSIVGMVSSFKTVANGGLVNYDYDRLEEYALEEYYSAFGHDDEDSILIVVVTAENNYDFDWYACVGYDISSQVNEMFGGTGTALGNAMLDSVDTQSYKNSLTRNLSDVVEKMQAKVEATGTKALKCSHTPKNTSHLVNNSGLNISSSVVDEALKNFTDATGVPVVIVVDTAENVFGKYVPAGDIITIVISLVIMGVAIFFIVRAIRKRKNDPNNPNNNNNNNSNNGGYNNDGYNNGGYNNDGYNGGY